MNEKLLAETNLCAPKLQLLDAQLAQIANVIPDRSLAQLRQIPIWVERSSQQFPCVCYHAVRGVAAHPRREPGQARRR